MGYASKAGRAHANARNPRAFAVCDRCALWYNHDALNWQFQWAGTTLTNLRLLVCDLCLDVPSDQLRAIAIPADPLPIADPRVESYITDESNYRVTSGQNTVDFWTGIPVPGGDTRITQDDNTRVTQTTGEPPGGLNQEPGTDPNLPDSIGGADPGLPYDFTDVPKTGPLD